MTEQEIKRFDDAILGGTVLACAVAETLTAAGRRCIIVEQGSTLGAEFAHTLRGCTLSADAAHPLGIAACYPPAVAPVLASRLLDAHIPCRMSASLISAEGEAGGYRLTLHHPGGTETLFVSQIIDTTTEGRLLPFAGKPATPPIAACIHARVFAPADQSADTPLPDQIAPGGLDGTFFFSHTIPADCPPPEGMQRLHDAFGQSEARQLGWRLATIPFSPDLTPAPPTEGWHIPSAQYAHAEEAYDAGLALGRRLCDGKAAQPVLRTPGTRDEGTYDLIVAGLGTAGAICAIAAAERGLRVLALEPLECLGGTSTAGGVVGYYRGIRGGIYTAVDDDATTREKEGFVPSRGVNAVCRAIALYARAHRAGVDMHFGAVCTGVLSAGKRMVSGVHYVDAEGLHIAHAQFTVDCTGNGDLCVAAGCAMREGRDLDNTYHLFSQTRMLYHPTRDCISGDYRDEGIIDPYSPDDYALHCLRAAAASLRGLQDKLGCYLGLAPLSGVREGRLVVGEETVTLDDFLHRRITDKPVFFEQANLDNHGKDVAFENRTMRDWLVTASMWGYDLIVPLPAGVLIPKGWRGLLIAGRQLSIDHDLTASVRMKDCMQKSGEAAAVLAACAIQLRCDAVQVPYAALHNALCTTGCLCAETRPGIARPAGKETVFLGYFTEPLNADALLPRPETGYAIWNAALASEAEVNNVLLPALCDERPQVRNHAALALALRGCDAGGDVLCAMIADRSGDLMRFSWTYNSTYATAAMSAAGRLGLRQALDVLTAVVAAPDKCLDIPLTDAYTGKTKLICDAEDMRFQHYTHAFVALCEIAAKHVDLRPQISSILQASLNKIDPPTTTMIGQPPSVRLASADKLRRVMEKLCCI